MTQPPVETAITGDQTGVQTSAQTVESGGDQGTGLNGGLSLATQNALLAMQQTNERAMRGMFESFNRQLLEFQERLSGAGLTGSSTTSTTAGASSAPGTFLLPGPSAGSFSTSQSVSGMADSIGYQGAPAPHPPGSAAGAGSVWTEGERTGASQGEGAGVRAGGGRDTLLYIKHQDPPAFASANKPYMQWRREALTWKQLMVLQSCDEKHLAYKVLSSMDAGGNSLGLKLKTTAMRKMGDDIFSSRSFEKLLQILDEENLGDAIKKKLTLWWRLIELKRDPFKDYKSYLNDFDLAITELEAAEVVIDPAIKGGILLRSIHLSESEEKIVLSSINQKAPNSYKEIREKIENVLLNQFLLGNKDESASKTLFAQQEKKKYEEEVWRNAHILAAQNTTSNSWGRKNVVTKRKNDDGSKRKNKVDRETGVPMKCHSCKCACTENCEHDCVFHFADKCPKKKKPNSEDSNAAGSDVTRVNFLNPGPSTEKVIPLWFITKVFLQGGFGNNPDLCIVDCGCPLTTAGTTWIKKHMARAGLRESDMDRISSPTNFMFGDGIKRGSRGIVKLKLVIGGELKVDVMVEEINADIPLLLGNSTLEKAGAELKFKDGARSIKLGEKVLPLSKLKSGHYGLHVTDRGLFEHQEEMQQEAEALKEMRTLLSNISPTVPPTEEEMFRVLVADTVEAKEDEKTGEKLSVKQLEHLHRIFGHIPAERLNKHIQASGYADSGEAREILEKIQEKCVGCCKGKKRIPKAKFSLPKADGRNQIVTLDLKECTQEGGYIFYLIDAFTKYTIAEKIPDKKASTIASVILKRWISTVGTPKFFHKDGGKEFNNQTFYQLCQYFGVKETTTPAYSPWFNGANERNHATVDRMVVMMREEQPELALEEALFWAVHAFNTLEASKGFTPMQLMMGANPGIPTLLSSNPTLLPEITAEGSIAASIETMQSARRALVACENDKVLKEALKARINMKQREVRQGNWVFVKQLGRSWEGPYKVIQIDGKIIWIERMGSLLRVNIEHTVVAPEKAVPALEVKTGADTSEANAQSGESQAGVSREEDATEENAVEGRVEQEIVREEDEPDVIVVDRAVSVADQGMYMEKLPVVEPDLASHEPLPNSNDKPSEISGPPDEVEAPEATEAPEVVEDAAPAEVRRTNRKRNCSGFTEDGEQAKRPRIPKVRERACHACVQCSRKKACPNKIRYNMFIPGLEESITEERDPGTVDIQVLLPVQIPKFRHSEKECVAAKEIELEKFRKYNAFEVVKKDQAARHKVLPMHWVLTEKVTEEGQIKTKARLTVMGNLEKNDTDIRSDSPTVQKCNLKMLLMLANMRNWEVLSMDAESAFLQTEATTRDIYVQPPLEAKTKQGEIWRLKRPVYGIRDASRAFYSNISKELELLGCEKIETDMAMYVWRDEEDQEGDFSGLIGSHVDDMLAAGSESFRKKVLDPLRKKFTFGEMKQMAFSFTGIKHNKEEENFTIDGNQMLKDLRVPDQEVLSQQEDGVLNEEGQSAFRSFIGQLNALANTIRPDLSFVTKQLSTKQNKASKSDMRKLRAVIKKAKENPEKIVLPNLGNNYEELVLLSFADASYKSLPDKISSVGGIITFMVNRTNKKAHLLEWHSTKLSRVCTSPSSAESLVINSAIGRIALLKSTLRQVMGPKSQKITSIVATDSKNSLDSTYSTHSIADGWNALDIAAIRQAVDKKIVDKVVKVNTEDQIADALTKDKQASVEKLLKTLRKGRLEEIDIDLE